MRPADTWSCVLLDRLGVGLLLQQRRGLLRLRDAGHLHETVVDERALRHEEEADELQRAEGVPAEGELGEPDEDGRGDLDRGSSHRRRLLRDRGAGEVEDGHREHRADDRDRQRPGGPDLMEGPQRVDAEWVQAEEEHEGDADSEESLHADDMQRLDNVLAHDLLLVHKHARLEDLCQDAEEDAEHHLRARGRPNDVTAGGLCLDDGARGHQGDAHQHEGDAGHLEGLLPPAQEGRAHEADEDDYGAAAHLRHRDRDEGDAHAKQRRRREVAAAGHQEHPLRHPARLLRLLPGSHQVEHGEAQELAAHHEPRLQQRVVEVLRLTTWAHRRHLHVLELQQEHVYCSCDEHDQHACVELVRPHLGSTRCRL
mmetsp:Transcript_93626/g.202487  ORF Transcript_93626/g.202487 Transcript_93626/m.202487 type:complete len:369 (-) Transcript_93626:245-1351(-)